MKTSSHVRRLFHWLHDGFVLSKTVLFIWGLVFSHVLVKYAVVFVLSDFLTYKWERYSVSEASMVMNLLDTASAVLEVAMTHVSEAYTRRFSVIIFCSAAYVMGLMLLWACTLSSDPEQGIGFGPFIIALVLIALGQAGEDPTLRDYFEYQLSEKVKNKSNKSNEAKDQELVEEREKSNRNRTGTSNFWWITASFIGIAIATFCFPSISWRTAFGISSFVMGATYVLFFSGIICYYPEETPPGSFLTTIYRVFMKAFKNRKLAYPRSEGAYYSNNIDQGPNNSNDRFYRRRNGDVHLSPRGPSFLRLLDKAAIIRNNTDAEGEDRNLEGENYGCTVEQVREVKSLYPLVLVACTFFPYSLVSASGNTYFVLQGSNMNFEVGNLSVPFMVFFVLKSFTAYVVRTIQSTKKLVRPIWSIGVGLFCSVLCSIAAWLVEHYRLSLIREYGVLDKPEREIPLSIMVLNAPYFLLGLMEGFAEDGLQTLVCEQYDQLSESISIFVPSGIKMMLAIGKFFSALLALILNGRWFKETINTSRVDKYFLLLAALCTKFFGIYICYAKYKLLPRLAVEPETNKEANIGLSSSSCPRDRTESSHDIELEGERDGI